MSDQKLGNCLFSPFWPKVILFRVLELFWWIIGLVVFFGCLGLVIAIPWHYLSPATNPLASYKLKDWYWNLILFPLGVYLVYYSFWHVIQRPVEWFWFNRTTIGTIQKTYTKKIIYYYKGSKRERIGYFLESINGESWEITRDTYDKIEKANYKYFTIVHTPVDREVRYVYVSHQALI